MDLILALAVSIGLLGGVATWLFLTLGSIQIWIAFIAWGSFYHCGGGTDGLQKSLTANVWGAVVGFVAMVLVLQVNLGLPGVLWASIAVALTVFILVLGAKIEALGAIPAGVYGYASVAGYTLLSGADVTQADMGNPLVVAVASMVLGAIFGIVSEKFAGMIKAAD